MSGFMWVGGEDCNGQWSTKSFSEDTRPGLDWEGDPRVVGAPGVFQGGPITLSTRKCSPHLAGGLPEPLTQFPPDVEWNPGTKEPTKGRESLFLSQWPQTQKDTCGEEGCSDPGGSVSVALSAKKSMWPAEKNLLYEFLGVAKNPSGPLKLRSKVEVDGLELKRKLTLPGGRVCRGRDSRNSYGPVMALPPNGCLSHGKLAGFPQ